MQGEGKGAGGLELWEGGGFSYSANLKVVESGGKEVVRLRRENPSSGVFSTKGGNQVVFLVQKGLSFFGGYIVIHSACLLQSMCFCSPQTCFVICYDLRFADRVFYTRCTGLRVLFD